MLCKKCGNEIKEGESFCSKCGKRIKPKGDKKSKQLIYTLVITILIILGAVAIVLVTNRDTDKTDNTITNTDISQDTNNNDTQNQEKQDFKYVQEDSNSYCGKSFKNVDFESFKSNVRELWFKSDLEYDTIMATNKALFGEKYSDWNIYPDAGGGYKEEIIFPYIKDLKSNSYIVGKFVDIYYNKDKTNVFGITIYISDYYLGRIGRSKLGEELGEIINCLPYDFKEEVIKRISSKVDNDINYKDFNVGYYENVKVKNEDYYLVNILCATNETETDNSYSTNNTETSNNTSQTKKIKQNVKYKFIGTSQQSADTDDSTYIEFMNNRFELLSTDSYYYMGTYVENGDNLTLNIDSINLGGEEMNLSKDEIGGEIQFKGKITNSGETIVITIENEELKFEL